MDTLDTKTITVIWLLISLHIVALIALIILHIINIAKKTKINGMIHGTFASMYCFVILVILTFIFDYVDIKDTSLSGVTSIYNVISFLTSCLNHLSQFSYFFLALEVLNDYIDKTLYNKPHLFSVCRKINYICFVLMILITTPSIGMFLYGLSIKMEPDIEILFDTTLLWQYYSFYTLLFCIILCVASINAIILSYMTKDGISFSGILLSPTKTMICVDSVSILFLIQAGLRFIYYLYCLLVSHTAVPHNFIVELNPWLQFFIIIIVHFPTMFILVFLLTPFTQPAKFNMKGY